MDDYDRYSFPVCFHRKSTNSSEVIVGVFKKEFLMKQEEHWLIKPVAAWSVDTLQKKFVRIDTTGVRCRVYSRGFR